MKHSLIYVLLCSVLVLTGCGKQQKTEKEYVPVVKIGEIAPYRQAQELIFPGRVLASSEVDLAFKVSGKIRRFAVKQGDYVRKGQLLVEMDDRDYRLQFSATEAEYKQVKAEVERVIRLYEQESVTQSDYDKAVSGLAQLSAKYETHKNALSDTRLYAPFDGYVQGLKYEANEMVAQGYPVISLIGAGVPEVEINIPASDYVNRDKFESYSATVDVLPGEEFPLNLVSIAPKGNLNQLYAMRLAFVSEKGKTLPNAGMSASVTIRLQRQETQSQITIPFTAVFEREGVSAVWVIDEATGTVHARRIVASEIHRKGNLVVREGLQAGDKIVIAGAKYLTEGQRVNPLSEPTDTNEGGLL